MPIPPTRGVGDVFHLLSSGCRRRLRAKGECRSVQTASAETGRAAMAARVLTSVEGSGAVLGLCLPAQGIPRLLGTLDGLRRSLPLPRALREPLPPRLPGEVQGVGA